MYIDTDRFHYSIVNTDSYSGCQKPYFSIRMGGSSGGLGRGRGPGGPTSPGMSQTSPEKKDKILKQLILKTTIYISGELIVVSITKDRLFFYLKCC